MSARSVVFNGLLVAAVVPAVVMAAQFQDMPGAHSLGWGGTVAGVVSVAAPKVTADALLAGVATPVAAAGALAFLAPRKEESLAFALAIAICAAGWLAYLWLDILLADETVRIVVATLLDDGNPAKAKASVDHLANFSTAGRLLFLALGATLVGVMLRPSPAAAAIAILILVAAAPGEARAGSVRIGGEAKDFTVAVGVKADPAADAEPLALTDGAYTFSFDASLFASGSYAERILVVEWTPKAPDVPAVGVGAFTVEIPVLLRKWRMTDTYRIEAKPFMGTGERALRTYEWMTEPGARWTRFLASLQQGAHYAYVASAELGQTRRALNSAVAGLAAIANAGGWVLPPQDLRERLGRSFGSTDPKLASLGEALDHAESNVWKDLPTIERSLRGETCEVVEKTFDYLAARKDQNPRAYALQLSATPDLLDAKRQVAMAACGANPADARPASPAS